MAKRICDACGKNKELEGGKTCEKGILFCLSQTRRYFDNLDKQN